MGNNITGQKSAAELREQLKNGEGKARGALAALFDGGSFAEFGAYVKRIPGELETAEQADFEGVVTGYGSVAGRLTYAFVQDIGRNKGAFSAVQAEKILRLYDAALKNEAPVVGIFDSAGAFVLEGVPVLAGYGRLMKKIGEAGGEIPQIAVVSGNCGGCTAVLASLFDFVVGAADGEFYVNPPFLTRHQLKDKSLGTAEYAAASGAIDLVCADTASAMEKVRELLGVIPQNAYDGPAIAEKDDDLNRLTPEVEALVTGASYDVKQLIAVLSDAGSFFEIGEKYAPEMVCGFASFGDLSVGVAASQPKVRDGALTKEAARKAAGFVDFCGRFDIPLLTLTDSCGFEVASEDGDYAAALAALASAYAGYDAPKVTVAVGATYGGAFTLLGSKSVGADVALALESAAISAMPVEAAVEFAWGKRIREAGDPEAERAALLEKYKDVLSSPLAAARAGEIDDVIACAELRQRITSSFELLTANYGG